MAKPALHMSDTLDLPIETVTETIAILGIRGSGKTNTAVVMTEELLQLGQQVVIIDPLDVWHGLRSSADGIEPGYPIVVLGGRHGDLPLTARDGALIADFVVDQQAPAVLSLRHFESQADQRRFVTEFARRLFYRKGEHGNDTPLMVVIDEASLFVPQRVGANEAQMVGAIQVLVRQGRASGLGVTLIDQRASSVNKDVLTQLQLLVCHRTSSPQDRKALDEWVSVHDKDGQRDTFMTSLGMLSTGQAWFWSPEWVDLFKMVQVRARHTFDSSRTPKPGEKRLEPKNLASIDLEHLRARMNETLDHARENDPAEMRKHIRELEQQLSERRIPVETVEVPVLATDELHRMEGLVVELRAIASGIESALARITAPIQPNSASAQVEQSWTEPAEVIRPDEPLLATRNSAQKSTRRSKARQIAPKTDDSSKSNTLSAPQQRILNVLADLAVLGLETPSKENVAVFAGYSSNSGGYRNYLGQLRSLGLIDYPSGGQVTLTDQGRRASSSSGRITSLRDLHAAWYSKLPNRQAEILRVLVNAYPRAVTKDFVAAQIGLQPTSGGYRNYLGALRSLGIIAYPAPNIVSATPLLFPSGLG